jgi:hypothetical protein
MTGPPASQHPPPRGRGAPRWALLLGGCGLLAALFLGLLAYASVRWFQASASGTPVTPAEVQQSLGTDVPIYPGAVEEPTGTRVLMNAARASQQVVLPGMRPALRSAGLFTTTDDAAKVLAFYDRKLAAAGWRRIRSGPESDPSHHFYQKGDEAVSVEASPLGYGEKGTELTLMRGQPDEVGGHYHP